MRETWEASKQASKQASPTMKTPIPAQKRHLAHTRSCPDSVIVFKGKGKKHAIFQAALFLVGSILAVYFVGTRHSISLPKNLKGVGRAGPRHRYKQEKKREEQRLMREEENFVQDLDRRYHHHKQLQQESPHLVDLNFNVNEMEHEKNSIRTDKMDNENSLVPCEFIVDTSIIPSCYDNEKLLGTFTLFNLKKGDLISINGDANNIYIAAHPTLANVAMGCNDEQISLNVQVDIARGSELYLDFTDPCVKQSKTSRLLETIHSNPQLPSVSDYDAAMDIIQDAVSASSTARNNGGRKGPGMNMNSNSANQKVDTNYIALIKKTLKMQSRNTQSCIAALIPDEGEKLRIALRNGIIESINFFNKKEKKRSRIIDLVEHGMCSSMSRKLNIAQSESEL